MHGYDIVDHLEIDPQLGGLEGFRRFSDRLAECGVGLIVDIVVNHMSIGGSENPWWLSVLEWGQQSPHAKSFDIDWAYPKAKGKLIGPLLARNYQEALATGDFELRFDEADGSFDLWYFIHRFPIRLDNYGEIISRIMAICPPSDANELAYVAYAIRADLGCADAPSRCEAHKRQLSAILCRNPAMQAAVLQALAMINVRRDVSFGSEVLGRLIACQHYRLTHWRLASSEINYRRFFDINSLAAIRIEDPDVFAVVHETTQLRAAKREILQKSFAGECERLVDDLQHAAEADPRSNDLTRNELREGLIALIAALPIYRTYLTSGSPCQEDVAVIEQAKSTITKPETDQALDFIVRLVLLSDGSIFGQALQERVRRKFQEITAPQT
jgi:maltooligosyltrehalose synthase